MAITSDGQSICVIIRFLFMLFYYVNSDELVANATNGFPSSNGVTYSVSVEQISGLLSPGSAGVNHGKL